MIAPTSRDKGVSPAQLGRSSCPSSYAAISPPPLLDTSDDAVLTTTESLLLHIPLILASDPLAEKTTERFCAGAHNAIGVFTEREKRVRWLWWSSGVAGYLNTIYASESLNGLLYSDTWIENEHGYLPGLERATCQNAYHVWGWVGINWAGVGSGFV